VSWSGGAQPLFPSNHAIALDALVARILDDVQPEERQKAKREMFRLCDELPKMAWWPIRQALLDLDSSFAVFSGNWRELENLLNALENPANISAFFAVSNRANLEEALIELARLLHNFVSSVKSLVDHQRCALVKSPEVATPGIEAIYESVTQRFRADGRLAFVQNLRSYVLHRSIVSSQARLTFVDGGEELTIRLQRDELLASDKWNGPARGFLDASEERFALRPLVQHYFESAERAMHELTRAVHEYHRDALEEFDPLARRHDELVDQIRPLAS
jgi:hypothetical protein